MMGRWLDPGGRASSRALVFFLFFLARKILGLAGTLAVPTDPQLSTLNLPRVQRALQPQPGPVHHVRINLRRRHVHVPEQILHAADVGRLVA